MTGISERRKRTGRFDGFSRSVERRSKGLTKDFTTAGIATTALLAEMAGGNSVTFAQSPVQTEFGGVFNWRASLKFTACP